MTQNNSAIDVERVYISSSDQDHYVRATGSRDYSIPAKADFYDPS
jgi:hypothetical protein